jgi:hypothetical protein
MRIGDPETDAVFDRLIKPTVASVGLTARRIDRLMHNERIDQKIVAELQSAAVVLADLTFARPSVYWEAGRAEGRGTPVIYTCKRDHFAPRPADEFGNYKVHFDLQTTNIVPWKSATDGRFARDLERRLRYVLRPLLRDQTQVEQRTREQREFAALPLIERRERVADIAAKVGRAVGLRGHVSGVDSKDFLIDPVWAAMAQYGSLLSYDGPKTAQEVRVIAVPKLTKRTLRAVHQDLTQGLMRRERARTAGSAGKAIIEHVVAVSFGRASPDLVDETLPNFARTMRGDRLTWSAEINSHALAGPGGKPVHRLGVLHVLSGIRSQQQVRETLQEVFADISSQTSGQTRAGSS